MSYASYSTRNTIGVKPLPPPTLSGLGWRRLSGQIIQLRGLGDLNMNDQAVVDALNAGIDPGTLETLVAEGASDGQLEALANGQTDLPTLMAQLTGNLPAPGSAAGTASTFPTPSGLTPDQQAQVQQAINQTGLDPTDESSWYSITGQLQQMNLNIKALEALMQKYPAVAAAPTGPAITQLRSDYTSLSSDWQGAYTAIFGAPPGGLNGLQGRRMDGLGALGFAPLIVIGYIAIFIATVAGLYALYEHYQVASAEAQAKIMNAAAAQTQAATNTTLAANQQALITQIAACQASGNTALCSQLASQLQATQQAALNASAAQPPPQTLTQWFESNWQWVALTAVVVMLGPNLIKKL